MKKSIYFSIFALMFGVSSYAQQTEQKTEQQQQRKELTVEERAKHRAERMRNQLLLGDDQYDKVYKLCLEQAKQEQARQEKMRAEEEAFAKDMSGILNESQQKRFEQLQQPRRMANRSGMHQGNFRPQGGNNRAVAARGQIHSPRFQRGGQFGHPQQNMNRRGQAAEQSQSPKSNTSANQTSQG